MSKRTISTKYNLITSFLYQLSSALINLFVRRSFLLHIGISSLNFDGFFSNIIQMLCLLDFGIGASATYYMSKAYATGDLEDIQATYKAFNILYKIVGVILCVLAGFICININWFVDVGSYDINYIRLVFIIIFIRTVIYYLSGTAKMALLCNQQNYYNMMINIICLIVFAFIKFGVIINTGNYIFYLISILFESWSINLLAVLVLKKQSVKVDVSRNKVIEKGKQIFDYGKKILLVNINQFIFNSTDNLVINYFLGLHYIGYMSNYYLIVNSVMLFATQILESANASIYNFLNDKRDRSVDSYNSLFNTVSFIAYCISCICVVGLFGITDEFIGVLYGQQYILGKGVILLMVLNLMVVLFQSPLTAFSTGAGIVNRESVYSAVVSCINIVVSIVACKIIGIEGILLGTLVANIVLLIGKQRITFQYLKMDSKAYIVNIFKYVIVTLISILVIKYLLPSECMNIIALFFRGLCCGIIILIDIFVFYKSEGFKQTINTIKTFLNIN